MVMHGIIDTKVIGSSSHVCIDIHVLKRQITVNIILLKARTWHVCVISLHMVGSTAVCLYRITASISTSIRDETRNSEKYQLGRPPVPDYSKINVGNVVVFRCTILCICLGNLSLDK